MSVTITLDPPLDGVTIEMHYKEFGMDELYGFGYADNGVFTFRNYPVGTRLQLVFPAQRFGDVWYKEARTREFDWYNFDWGIGLKLTKGDGPLGSITEINLPDVLGEGSPITGSVVITNIGDITAPFRCRFITEWNGSEFLTEETELIPGASLEATIPTGEVLMPNQDASIKMQAERHYVVIAHTDQWEVDDLKSH